MHLEELISKTALRSRHSCAISMDKNTPVCLTLFLPLPRLDLRRIAFPCKPDRRKPSCLMSNTHALQLGNLDMSQSGRTQLACAVVQLIATRHKPSVPEKTPPPGPLRGVWCWPRAADSISGPCARQSNFSDCIAVQLTERPSKLIVRTPPETCSFFEMIL